MEVNMKKAFGLSILLIMTPGLFAKNIGLAAPTYLSNPYFATCKQYCPEINYGSYNGLDMICLQDCMDFIADFNS